MTDQQSLKWIGELTLAQGWAYYHGPAGDAHFHRHFPTQIVFASKGVATAKLEGDQIQQGRQLIIPSGTRHQLEEYPLNLDLLFVEPALISPHTNRFTTLDQWIAYLSNAKPQIADKRLSVALKEIDKSLDQKITLGAVARKVAMSKSLFSKKFRILTGLPLRRYVLWRRLYRAVIGISKGHSATEAAHYAGFSDAAHFSRTMKETFGVSPSESVQQIKMTVLPGQILPLV